MYLGGGGGDMIYGAAPPMFIIQGAKIRQEDAVFPGGHPPKY
jgi:hypothetical protein